MEGDKDKAGKKRRWWKRESSERKRENFRPQRERERERWEVKRVSCDRRGKKRKAFFKGTNFIPKISFYGRYRTENNIPFWQLCRYLYIPPVLHTY